MTLTICSTGRVRALGEELISTPKAGSPLPLAIVQDHLNQGCRGTGHRMVPAPAQVPHQASGADVVHAGDHRSSHVLGVSRNPQGLLTPLRQMATAAVRTAEPTQELEEAARSQDSDWTMPPYREDAKLCHAESTL